MKGIDVSNNNGTINFNLVKASGIEIVYIKATEGLTYIDPTLKTFYNNAKAAGLKVGFYHFLRDNDPVLEAKYFLNALGGLTPDCRYVIDVELTLNQSLTTISSNVRKFADYLITQGKEVAIYSGDYFYRDNLNNTVKNLPLWVANYGGAVLASSYVGLQYSETGSVNGISGHVDLDTFYNGILITSEEEKNLENLVVYSNPIDQVYAEKLAFFLKCPTIHGDIPFVYNIAKNIYCVGAPGKLPFTSYATRIFKGSNRVETQILVDDFIAKGEK